MQYHLLNRVKVLQPRWHDRVILPKCDKFVDGFNIITVNHPNYPSEYVLSKKRAETYPKEVKSGRHGEYEVYVIPLDQLQTIQEHQQELREIKEAVGIFGW